MKVNLYFRKDDLYERMQLAARLEGLSVSAWLRRTATLALAAAERRGSPSIEDSMAWQDVYDRERGDGRRG